VTFRGYTIAKTGAWGQGPALLAALKILEGFDDVALDQLKLTLSRDLKSPICRHGGP